ncbi:hypothetical protein FA15DRAFT_564641, partial [Coprinopsis marcescibilis]
VPKHLRYSTATRDAINEHIKSIGMDIHKFTYSIEDQSKAQALSIELGLYTPQKYENTRNVQSKLAIQHTKTLAVTTAPKFERHTRIFQCQAGIDNGVGPNASKNRQIPWRNVGCSFWVRYSTVHVAVTGECIGIDQISGVFDHCDACLDLVEMDRDPLIPLNIDVCNHALDLLRQKTPLALLRDQCLKYSEKRCPGLPGNHQSRFHLVGGDISSLYRTIAQELGIDQKSAAEENLDLWFRAKDPSPPVPGMGESVLHYQPHVEGQTDRFELIICSEQMRDALWKFGHKKQVLMDLTFGFCSAPLLLTILMVIDDNGKGIPVAFIVFTARKSAKAAHADYNTALLTRHLQMFKEKIGKSPSGEDLTFLVANTDNDTRERKALATTFPDILLLLCSFHTAQSWKNGINRSLAGVPKGEERQAVRKRLGSFVWRLLHEVIDHDEALDLYRQEREYWEGQSKHRSMAKRKQAEGALKFLKYFHSYLGTKAMWLSWSMAGVIKAAEYLGIPVQKITRTNNPLENFNGLVKNHYFEQYKHSGRLPRVDYWVQCMIASVIPAFFDKRIRKQQMTDYRHALRHIQPGSSHAAEETAELD